MQFSIFNLDFIVLGLQGISSMCGLMVAFSQPYRQQKILNNVQYKLKNFPLSIFFPAKISYIGQERNLKSSVNWKSFWFLWQCCTQQVSTIFWLQQNQAQIWHLKYNLLCLPLRPSCLQYPCTASTIHRYYHLGGGEREAKLFSRNFIFYKFSSN